MSLIVPSSGIHPSARIHEREDAANSTSEEESNESSIRSAKVSVEIVKNLIDSHIEAVSKKCIAGISTKDFNPTLEQTFDDPFALARQGDIYRLTENYYNEKIPLELREEIYSYLPTEATFSIKKTSRANYEETLENVKWVLTNKKNLKFRELLFYSFHFLKKSDQIILGEKFKGKPSIFSAEDWGKIYPAIEKAASLCINLHSLSLSGLRCITNFSFLEKIPNLKELDLSDCNIADIAFIPTSIETLDLRGCEHIPAENFSNLSRLNNLKKIYLFGDCKISDLKLLPSSIETLNLDGCEHIPAENFINLNRFNNLKTIFLCGCKISDLTFIPTSIETLQLWEYDHIPAENFSNLNRFNNLKNIQLRNCEISDIAFIPTSIETLDLDGCGHIPAENFINLNRFNHLKEIHLTDCKITDIRFTPTSIERLNLNLCQHIPEENFINLNRFNHLKVFFLNNCKITDISSIPTTIEDLYLIDLAIQDISLLLGFPKLQRVVLSNIQAPSIQAHGENLRSKGVSVEFR